ncbi:MAG: hypothetical protein IKC18_02790, partial [Bacteroidaceae bacterium]|nr:hypothetical protein [Bacteroidaceae bacterium]
PNSLLTTIFYRTAVNFLSREACKTRKSVIIDPYTCLPDSNSQKTRKGDFGPSEENANNNNPLIVKQIQNHEKPFENTRKKDLSVS